MLWRVIRYGKSFASRIGDNLELTCQPVVTCGYANVPTDPDTRSSNIAGKESSL